GLEHAQIGSRGSNIEVITKPSHRMRVRIEGIVESVRCNLCELPCLKTQRRLHGHTCQPQRVVLHLLLLWPRLSIHQAFHFSHKLSDVPREKGRSDSRMKVAGAWNDDHLTAWQVLLQSPAGL